MLSLWIILLLVAISMALWQLLKVGSRPRGYPPGPPTLPILGNLHQIPFEKRHIQFQKWAQEYGYVLHK
jgi:hypothetical protein